MALLGLVAWHHWGWGGVVLHGVGRGHLGVALLACSWVSHGVTWHHHLSSMLYSMAVHACVVPHCNERHCLVSCNVAHVWCAVSGWGGRCLGVDVGCVTWWQVALHGDT